MAQLPGFHPAGIGASHLIPAEAIAGKSRHKEALPHAPIAHKLLSLNAIPSGAEAMAADTHRTLTGIPGRPPITGA